MERLVYAKDLYYGIKKSKNNFKLEFIVAYGKTAYKIDSNERVFISENLFPVWEENELGNYDLNLPEKAINVYRNDAGKLFEKLPHFMTNVTKLFSYFHVFHTVTLFFKLRSKVFASTEVLSFFIHAKCVPNSRAEDILIFNVMHTYRYTQH